MNNNLDFDDIANSLFLDNPLNAKLANLYILNSLLSEAEKYPELRKMPATGDIIALAHQGYYEPLAEMDLQEAASEKVMEVWSNLFMDEVSPEEQIDLITLLQKAEDMSEEPGMLELIGESNWGIISQVGASYRCIKDIHLTGVLLREHCASIVKAVYLVSKEIDLEPEELVYWQMCRDMALKKAYPSKDAAGLYLINTNLFQLNITKSLLLRDSRLSELVEDYSFPPQEGENNPTLQEIDEALEIDRKYVLSELDRIYG